MKKLILMIAMAVASGMAMADIGTPNAYFSFEGDNGSYGAGSTDNPAWRENISGAAANYVGNGVPTNYPQITADGVKGDAFYSTDPAASGPTMTLNYYGGTEDVFSGVQSYTITGWLNTRDAAEAGSGTVFLRDWNATEIKWNTNGRFQIYDQIDLNWRYSDWGDADSNGEWIFFAITRDSSGIKFYHGDETNAVYMGASVTNLSLGATADAARLILGGRTYNGSDPYANLDMDELRIYSAADDSAALSIGQIEAIRQFDQTVPTFVIPDAYFSFEGDNGSYGEGSMDNPAWQEKISGAFVDYLGDTNTTSYPRITADGVRGDAFYATDPAMAASTNTITLNYTDGMGTNLFSGVQSYTITGWLNTRDAAKDGSDSYVMRSWAGGPEIFWHPNGRLQLLDTEDVSPRYAAWGDGYSHGEWVFFAITRDSSGIKFYHGDETNAVYVGASVSGLSLGATGDAARWVMGGRTYWNNVNDVPYANFDMDEVRIYSATDDSAALSRNEIELIRQVDLTAAPQGPVYLSVQAGSGSITISSDDFEPTVTNMLQMKTDLTGGSWSNVSAITGTTTNWVISPLPGTESFYRVQTLD